MTSITSSALDSLYTNSTKASDGATKTYNQFLNLLTTQLQHQDPLDPMDSSKFTDQLVSFSQVEQSILTNQKLDAMLTQNANNQISQSLGYIGKDVYFKGNTAYYDGTQSDMKLAYAIDGDATSAKLHILDKNGSLVRTIQVPPATKNGSLVWDGKDDSGNQLAEGNYTVAVDALDANGVQVDTYTAIPGHVEGIEAIEGTLYLALKGDTRIDSTTVLSISDPDDVAQAPDTSSTGSTS